MSVSKNILVCSTWSSLEGRLMETARGRLAPKPEQGPPLFVSPGHERCQSRTLSKKELMPPPLNSRTVSSFPPPHQLQPPSQTQVALSCLPHHLPWEPGTAPRWPHYRPIGRLCTPKALRSLTTPPWGPEATRSTGDRRGSPGQRGSPSGPRGARGKSRLPAPPFPSQAHHPTWGRRGARPWFAIGR